MLSIDFDNLFGDHLYIDVDKAAKGLFPLKYDGILSYGGFNELELSLIALSNFIEQDFT